MCKNTTLDNYNSRKTPSATMNSQDMVLANVSNDKRDYKQHLENKYSEAPKEYKTKCIQFIIKGLQKFDTSGEH